MATIFRDELYVSSQRRDSIQALQEIALMVRYLPRAFREGWRDIRNRYRRTTLGPIWLTVGTLVFAAGFSIIGTSIFGRTFGATLTYILAGVVFWQFVTVSLIESAALYPATAGVFLARKTSLLGQNVRVVVRNTLVLLHTLPVVVAIALWRGGADIIYSLWIIPGIFAICGMLFAMSLLFSLIGSRWRDLHPIVSLGAQFGIFITPIFWPDTAVTSRSGRMMIEFNPMYHVISLVRKPLLGEPILAVHWYVVGGTAVACLLVWLIFFVRFRRRIPFWI